MALNSVFNADAKIALEALQRGGPSTREAYRQIYGRRLEKDFRDRFDGTPEAMQALALMWPVMSVGDRVEGCLGWDDDEQGLLSVIRTASDDEIAAYRSEGPVPAVPALGRRPPRSAQPGLSRAAGPARGQADPGSRRLVRRRRARGDPSLAPAGPRRAADALCPVRTGPRRGPGRRAAQPGGSHLPWRGRPRGHGPAPQRGSAGQGPRVLRRGPGAGGGCRRWSEGPHRQAHDGPARPARPLPQASGSGGTGRALDGAPGPRIAGLGAPGVSAARHRRVRLRAGPAGRPRGPDGGPRAAGGGARSAGAGSACRGARGVPGRQPGLRGRSRARALARLRGAALRALHQGQGLRRVPPPGRALRRRADRTGREPGHPGAHAAASAAAPGSSRRARGRGDHHRRRPGAGPRAVPGALRAAAGRGRGPLRAAGGPGGPGRPVRPGLPELRRRGRRDLRDRRGPGGHGGGPDHRGGRSPPLAGPAAPGRWPGGGGVLRAGRGGAAGQRRRGPDGPGGRCRCRSGGRRWRPGRQGHEAAGPVRRRPEGRDGQGGHGGDLGGPVRRGAGGERARHRGGDRRRHRGHGGRAGDDAGGPRLLAGRDPRDALPGGPGAAPGGPDGGGRRCSPRRGSGRGGWRGAETGAGADRRRARRDPRRRRPGHLLGRRGRQPHGLRASVRAGRRRRGPGDPPGHTRPHPADRRRRPHPRQEAGRCGRPGARQHGLPGPRGAAQAPAAHGHADASTGPGRPGRRGPGAGPGGARRLRAQRGPLATAAGRPGAGDRRGRPDHDPGGVSGPAGGALVLPAEPGGVGRPAEEGLRGRLDDPHPEHGGGVGLRGPGAPGGQRDVRRRRDPRGGPRSAAGAGGQGP